MDFVIFFRLCGIFEIIISVKVKLISNGFVNGVCARFTEFCSINRNNIVQSG